MYDIYNSVNLTSTILCNYNLDFCRNQQLTHTIANMEQHVFSKRNKYFASISDNGVLKVWDTETQELKCDYIPNLQTSAPCTSLIWVTLAAQVCPDTHTYAYMLG